MNSSREYLKRFAAEAAASLRPGALMLDAGAGDCPYKDIFTSKGIVYESSDFCEVDKPYSTVTYRCRLEAVPVENQRFDMVFLSQVLEHLPEPLVVLTELNRILKPGGTLWLSAPLYYEEHEKPYDFYRYTQFGLRHLLGRSGFEIDSLEWLEGFNGTLAHQFERAAKNLRLHPRNFGHGFPAITTAGLMAILRPLLRVASRRLSAADLVVKITERGHCKNYRLVARKPTSASFASPR